MIEIKDSQWEEEMSILEHYPFDEECLSEMIDENNITEENAEDFAKEIVEDEGWCVCKTLKEACDNIYEWNDNDAEECVRDIDVSWGNCVGVFPLNLQGDWFKQIQVFLQYMKKFHPEEDISELWEDYENDNRIRI